MLSSVQRKCISVKQKLGKQMLKLASGAAVETFGPCPSKTLS